MALALSTQRNRDAALIRATTDLFVQEPEHDRDEIRRFEELATHFLPKVPASDRAFVAERLSTCADAPPALMRALGKDLIEIASPVLKRSPVLTPFDLLAIIAATGPMHHRVIATRPDLAPDVMTALRLTGDRETIEILMARRSTRPSPVRPAAPPAPRRTPVPAQPSNDDRPLFRSHDEAVATAKALTAALTAELQALAATTIETAKAAPAEAVEAIAEAEPAPVVADISPPPAAPATPATIDVAVPEVVAEETIIPVETEAAAEIAAPVAADEPAFVEPEADPEPAAPPAIRAEDYLHLDREGRLAVLAQLASEPFQPQRAARLRPDQALRALFNGSQLSGLARKRQHDALVQTIAEGLRLDTATVSAMVDDPSGEPLVVLLKAIGVSDVEAQQVLLLANPTIGAAVETFFRLADLHAGIERSVADRLVSAWREEPSKPAALPVHKPHYAEAPFEPSARPAPASRPQPQPALRPSAPFGRRTTNDR